MNHAPHHPDQAQLVERVFALTLEIDEAALLFDWQRAARLTGERSPLLRAITTPQEPAALALIRRIQSMDTARLEQARIAQAELAAEYRGAMANANAARQYQRIAAF